MAAVTLPKRIKVGAAVYRVRSVHDLVLRKQSFGRTNNSRQRIQIDARQAADSKADTLLHECLHAIIHQSGSGMTLDLSNDDEEKLIRVLAPWLLLLLRDNPELVECLTAKVE